MRRDLVVLGGNRFWIDGEEVILSGALQYHLFEMLWINRGIIVFHDALIERIWGGDATSDLELHRLHCLVSRLRKKLPSGTIETRIETRRGIGYGILGK